MKIVVTDLDHRYDGIFSSAKMFDFLHWEVEKYPVFDMLELEKPDLVLVDLKYITTSLIKAFNEYNTKIVLFGQGVPQNLNPTVLVAKPSTSKVMRKNIESDQYTTLYLSDSANIVDIFGGQYNSIFESEFAYIYRDNTPEHYTQQMDLLCKFTRDSDIKIYGVNNLRVVFPEFIGNVSDKEISSIYKSAKIVIDYNANDILNIAANAGYAITNIDNGLYPFSSDIYSLRHKKKKTSIALDAQSLILENDTCYHRLIDILNAAGLRDEATEVHNRLKEITCELV